MPATASIFQRMPRMDVDAAPVTSLGTAAAAVAPYAEALAAAAAPIARDEDEGFDLPDDVPAPWAIDEVIAEEKPKIAPMRRESAAAASFAVAPMHAPMAAAPVPEAVAGAGGIAFGRRADADQKAVVITPKSVRGYKLPPSSLLYQSEEHASVREDALREEARVLVEKCAEFGVDGQVTQINPGPVVTTFEFRPDAGVKYARVTGLADDLCLAMAAESILIERMAGEVDRGHSGPEP